jgi:hypothetical protein
MEMLFSGSLTKEQVKMVVDYRTTHHDVILGMPTAYGYSTTELAGFLSYGHGYGLIQYDMIREALLMMYSDMAHQYTRGTWTAPETRNVLIDRPAAPYCTPAQLVVSLMTRWLLVFEDPQSETVRQTHVGGRCANEMGTNRLFDRLACERGKHRGQR